MLKTAGGNGKSVEIKDLRKLNKAMSTMTNAQLLTIPGMEAKRVDMILAGSLLLEECMDALGAKKVQTTEFSLRDGILKEELELVRKHEGSHIALHLPDLYAKAARFGCSEPHIRQVVTFSETLFDRLKPVHRLKQDWRIYLTAAAILHDVGEAVTPTRHEQHTYYIIKNADFPSMEKWETEFIAQLCRWHSGGRPDEKELPFARDRFGKEQREAFFKLLAILRVADSLDRGHKSTVKIQRIALGKSVVRLLLTGKTAIDLEILRVEQKRALFEQIMGRRLLAERSART